MREMEKGRWKEEDGKKEEEVPSSKFQENGYEGFAKDKGKFGKTVEGAEKLSLGISIVVAILMGIGLGILMKNFFHQTWLLWLGVFWGIAAAVINIRIEYKKLQKEFKEIEEKYKNYEINKK